MGVTRGASPVRKSTWRMPVAAMARASASISARVRVRRRIGFLWLKPQ